MRRILLSLLLVCLVVPVTAQDPDKEKDKEPADEPVLPDKLDKVTLTRDVGAHTAIVTGVFFTPDSKQVVTVSADHTIRVWDALSGQPVRVLYPPGFGGIGAAALAPDGKTLAVASRYPDGDKTVELIYLVGLADGRVERVLKGHPRPVEVLAFSPDGKRLASTSAGNPKDAVGKEGTVRLWDVATGNLEKSFRFLGNPSSIFRAINRGLAFSPDGQRLARVRLSGGPGDILDLATGKPTAKLAGWNVAWSPDGKTLATVVPTGKSRHLQLWNPDGSERLRLLEENATGISSVVFGPDSRTLLVTWGGAGGLRASLFDAVTGKLVLEPAKVKGGKHGALSPDGQLAATTIFATLGLTVWKTADGTVVREVNPGRSVVFNSNHTGWLDDGKAVLWPGMHGNRLFDLAGLELRAVRTAKELRELKKAKGFSGPRTGPALAGLKRHMKGYCRTLVGKDVAASAYLGRIYLYDAATGKELRNFQAHYGEISELVPSPDDRFLLSTSMDQTVKVWDLKNDRPLLSLYVKGNDWVAWTEEGYYAATPGGERMIGWKVDNGIDNAATFYPAEQFRKVLYRPDVIRLVLAKGSVAGALKAAEAARGPKEPNAVRAPAQLEKLLPAGVSLTQLPGTQLPTIKLQVAARQSCAEQPIKSLRLLVDGRPLPDRQAYVSFPEGKEQAQHQATWTVELPPGKHKLSVLARSRDDTPSVSNALTVTCPLPPAARPVLHHVAVGVSKYKNPKLDLQFAKADAEQLAGTVAQSCRGPGKYYRDVQSQCLLDKEATCKAVLDAIAAVRKCAKANDLLVFSFAGHGVREEGEFFLLTHEADVTNAKMLQKTAVSGTALRAALADFPCQVLLMLDACHSGALGAGALAGYRPASDEAARALADVDLRVAVMCAALGHEEALEQKGNGLFTKAVLRALQHDPYCFFDRQTGEMNVYHLQAFVSQEVARDSDYKQTPYLKMPLASPPFVITQFAP